jgi:hypothetical protein
MHPGVEIFLGWWMLHSRDSNLWWELDLRRKGGHVAQGLGVPVRRGRGCVPWMPKARIPHQDSRLGLSRCSRHNGQIPERLPRAVAASQGTSIPRRSWLPFCMAVASDQRAAALPISSGLFPVDWFKSRYSPGEFTRTSRWRALASARVSADAIERTELAGNRQKRAHRNGRELPVAVEGARTASVEYNRLGRLHILAADLKIEAVRIFNVKTVVGVGLGIKAATI